MIVFVKSMINFEEETNMFVRYIGEFVKSGALLIEVLCESFHSQK